MEKSNQHLQGEVAQLEEKNEQHKVQIKSLEKRLREKEKKCTQQDEKIHDLQEEAIKNSTDFQNEMQSAKSLHDHQISEYKKRVMELEESAATYKDQLAQQKQLEAQTNQLNQTQISKLQSALEVQTGETEMVTKQLLDTQGSLRDSRE